jgi:phosphopantothenoylcysteine decarboxylase/phosphopantothenate--cysteine ligase
LKKRGVIFVEPQEGVCACGEEGLGKLASLESICETFCSVTGFLDPCPLAGKRVLVTSGPTHEPIDPVRYLANGSSGQQGHALARAAAQAGADVTLVSGPVALADPLGVRVIHVKTAQEMEKAVEDALPVDIGIFAAAVSDWRIETFSERKLKKAQNPSRRVQLTCVENPDILSLVAQHKVHRPSLVIGFAAETHDLISEAQRKLHAKRCDWIIANDAQCAIGGKDNKIHIIKKSGVPLSWPSLDKDTVAKRLIAEIVETFSVPILL